MKNKKTAIICSLLVTACLIPGIAGASALNAQADPTPALQISDQPYTPASPAKSDASAIKTVDDPFVPPPASFPPAKVTAPAPAPAAQLPEIKSADASQVPALQISDEPYAPAAWTAAPQKPGVAAPSPKKSDSSVENAKALQSWVDADEPRKIPVKSATAQPPAPAAAKTAETIAWSPAPAPVVAAKPEKTTAVVPPAPAQDEHYKQALLTMQQQIDQLAKDNAKLQSQLKTTSTVKVAAVPVGSVESSDFFHVKASRNVTIPATEIAALPPIEAQEAKIPADVQKQLDNLKAQNSALQAKVRALDGRGSIAGSATALEDISPASGDAPDGVALTKHDKKFASLGDIDKEESYLEARRESGLDDLEPGAPTGKDFAKLLGRYKQSEEENTRLGEMVKSSKDQCDTEKKQLEGMLFDPKIADEQQRDYVSDLEKQLTDAQATNAEQKRHYELQIRLLKAKLGKRVD